MSSHLGPYSCFQNVLKEAVHQNLTVVKDRHLGADRLVQKKLAFVRLNTGQVLSQCLMPCKQRGCHQTAYIVCLTAANHLCIYMGYAGSPSFCRRLSCLSACKSPSRNRCSLFSFSSIQHSCVNSSVLCTFFRRIPSSSYNFRFLQ